MERSKLVSIYNFILVPAAVTVLSLSAIKSFAVTLTDPATPEVISGFADSAFEIDPDNID